VTYGTLDPRFGPSASQEAVMTPICIKVAAQTQLVSWVKVSAVAGAIVAAVVATMVSAVSTSAQSTQAKSYRAQASELRALEPYLARSGSHAPDQFVF
jgi:hypothetical protein